MSRIETVIEPYARFSGIDFQELFHYRDLFYFLVWRDVKVLYKQTVLGFSWAIIRPFLAMVIFTVIFGKMIKMSSDGVPYPVFSFAALVPWTFFSTAYTKASLSLVNHREMLTKIYFPRIIFPLTSTLSGLVDFALALVVLVMMIFWYQIPISLSVLWLPLLVVLMLMTTAGIGMWFAALAVQYRDVKHANQFIVQILMYVAPVVWPSSKILESFPEYGTHIMNIYGLFPMAGVIEGFRSCLLGTVDMPWSMIGMGFLSSFVVFGSGLVYFHKMEYRFSDVA